MWKNFCIAPNMHSIHELSMFFPYIPSCEAHKQFGAEPVQCGLEINFNWTKRSGLLCNPSKELIFYRKGNHDIYPLVAMVLSCREGSNLRSLLSVR